MAGQSVASVFEVDLRAGEVRKHGFKIKLQDQAFQILQVLLKNAGAVVTREELRQRIWPADTFVDFDQGSTTRSSVHAKPSATRP